MIAHLIACPHASASAKKVAKQEKGGKSTASTSKTSTADASSSDDGAPAKKKRKVFKNVERNMRQSELKVFRGIDIPFSDAQAEMIPSDEDEEEHISSRLEEMAAESAGGTPTPDGDVPAPPPPGRSSKWLPCSLAKLFGGQIPQPPTRAPRRAFTREELLMELLAAEHSDEEPDDGELEGSGDDYEGD
ncbi:hypothetical protein B0H10DRAFT_2433837 [Mycena sp. CBHHK59/15]|nr:hypothetical protein B0H10DRAFT_2433837 [Mycena sp. CBHHK59/15]